MLQACFVPFCLKLKALQTICFASICFFFFWITPLVYVIFLIFLYWELSSVFWGIFVFLTLEYNSITWAVWSHEIKQHIASLAYCMLQLKELNMLKMNVNSNVQIGLVWYNGLRWLRMSYTFRILNFYICVNINVFQISIEYFIWYFNNILR